MTTQLTNIDATCPKCRTLGKVCEITLLPAGPDGFCSDSCRSAAKYMERGGYAAAPCDGGVYGSTMVRCDACDGQGHKCCAACGSPVDCEAALRSWSLDWTCSTECAEWERQNAAANEWGEEPTIILSTDDAPAFAPVFESPVASYAPPKSSANDTRVTLLDLPAVSQMEEGR